MATWKKNGAMQWGANVGRIRAEITEDGAGKYHWTMQEQLPPHHRESGVENKLEWAKGAAEVAIRDHKSHIPFALR